VTRMRAFRFGVEIVDRLHERRARWGSTYFTLQQPLAHEFAEVVARLAGEGG
jgi:hypothetical protein